MSVNTPKAITADTCSGWIVWYVNFISIKLFKKENMSLSLWKRNTLYLESSINILIYQVYLEEKYTYSEKNTQQMLYSLFLTIQGGKYTLRDSPGGTCNIGISRRESRLTRLTRNRVTYLNNKAEKIQALITTRLQFITEQCM